MEGEAKKVASFLGEAEARGDMGEIWARYGEIWARYG